MIQPGKPNVEVIIVEEPQYMMEMPSRPKGRFMEQWSGGYEQNEDKRLILWEQARDRWLEVKSTSAHTRRSYEHATLAWFDFLAEQRHETTHRPVKRWDATSEHVHHWQNYLASERPDPRDITQLLRPLSPSSINQRLAAVSSFYEFVCNARVMVDGVEVSLLTDSLLRDRANPFKVGNVRRAKVKSFHRAKPLGRDTERLLVYLEKHKQTATGARNHALILTYLLTGWRNSELLRMRREDLRPHSSKPGAIVFTWRGKGGKEQPEEIPARAWHAITRYLELAGRWQPGVALEQQAMAPEAYIWLPLVTHNLANLKNVAQVNEDAHLSEGSAVRILRTALKNAGVADPDSYRVHDLRHTHARSRLVKGDDVKKIQDKMHHANLNTTQIYLEMPTMKDDPVDTDSEELYQQMRLTLG